MFGNGFWDVVTFTGSSVVFVVVVVVVVVLTAGSQIILK